MVKMFIMSFKRRVLKFYILTKTIDLFIQIMQFCLAIYYFAVFSPGINGCEGSMVAQVAYVFILIESIVFFIECSLCSCCLCLYIIGIALPDDEE